MIRRLAFWLLSPIPALTCLMPALGAIAWGWDGIPLGALYVATVHVMFWASETQRQAARGERWFRILEPRRCA